MKNDLIVVFDGTYMMSTDMAFVVEGFELSSDTDISVGTMTIKFDVSETCLR